MQVKGTTTSGVSGSSTSSSGGTTVRDSGFSGNAGKFGGSANTGTGTGGTGTGGTGTGSGGTPSSWNNGGGGGGWSIGSLNLGKTEAQKQAEAQAAQKKQMEADAKQLQTTFDARQKTSAGKIDDVYDKQLASEKAALQGAFDKSLADQEFARSQIGGVYQKASNDAAIQFERNKRNLNAEAMANGLSTGGGTQQQLALNQTWNTEYGNLKAAEAGEYAQIEHQIAQLKTQFQNDIAKAIADNDYKRAAALLDDFNNQQKWLDEQAKTMASFGNFAGYARLLGNGAANSMAQMWALQNPGAAYAAGLITAEQYEKATGETAKGRAGSVYGLF